MKQLMEYIIALSNLYGLVHQDKVLEIYNSQHPDPLDRQRVTEVMADPPEGLERAFIYTVPPYFVHETVLEFNMMEDLLTKKDGKPHYVPKKQELLRYTDDRYFEKNEEYLELLEYIKQHLIPEDPEYAEEICEDIHGTLAYGMDYQGVMDIFNHHRIRFADMNQLNEITGRVINLSNNLRIWENNGHTPREILREPETPRSNPWLKKAFDGNKTNVIDLKTRQRIDRNDPCPCGSNEIYNRCCLQ